MRALWLAAITLAGLVDTSGALGATIACSDRDDVLAQLGSEYKEAPSAVGLSNKGALIEVLTSETGDTWTIIVSTPQGVSCLVAAGESWTPVEWKAPTVSGEEY